MSKLQCQARRLIVTGGVAVAVAAAPAVALFAAPVSAAANCPAGETEDLYTDNCVPEMAPNVPGGIYPTETSGGSLPSVSGIPCTGSNTGQCIGLEEEQANTPNVTPNSSLSSSP